jgi:DNA-binding NarL/FixJ family response regulator
VRDGPPRTREAPGGRRWRIAIAARPSLMCEALSLALENEPGLDLEGRAGNEEEARRILRRGRPSVLLLDYEDLGPSCERVIQRLRRLARATRILVLATRSSDETVERVIRAGASGLVGKQQTFATLVHAIRAVAAGELWANRRATAHLVEFLADPTTREAAPTRLTRREREITEAVGQGLRNKDIGRRLDISEKTVKSHLNNIFRKLEVDNRFAAGLYARDLQPRV